MRINSSPSAGSTIVDKLKIYEGGTGAADAAAARTAFGLVASADSNQANGHAGLDGNGLLSASVIPDDGAAPISLQGPTSAIVNRTISFTITNYDIFTAYSISATLGTVVQDKSTLYYTAGATPGAGTIVINGRTVNVTVQGVQPVAPTLSGNDNGGTSTNVVVNGMTSAFAMNTTSANTHLNTDWQLASDINFTTIVTQSLADATNKLGWTAGSLATSTTYYLRARHRDSTGAVGDWSNTVTVTTKATFYVQTEEARLVPSNPSGSVTQYGFTVAIDGTGQRVAVSHMNGAQTSCVVYVFVRSGSNWTLEQTLTDAQNNFGQKGISMTSAGDKLLAAGTSQCYLYTRSGSTWTKQGAISQWTGYYFDTCCISPDGTRAAITAHVDTSPFDGSTRTYTVGATALTFEATLTNPQSTTNSWYGVELSMSTDATYLLSKVGNSSSGGTVGANVFLRTGTSWAHQQYLDFGQAGDSGSGSAALNGTGDRAVVVVKSGASTYAVVVWKRTNTTWAQEQTLISNASVGTSKVRINSAGDEIAHATANGAAIYTRVNTTWTLRTTLTYSVTADKSITALALSADGTRLINSNYTATVNAVSSAGVAYIHTS